MGMHLIDWLIVGVYVLFALAVGVVYAKRAGKDVDEFFLSGRTLPWWIAGTSMIATSFAADTPLVITGWVRDSGIWRNWLWWCYCGGGMLAVFLFARGWRRGGVMTKAELAELRYGGKSSAILRGTLGLMHGGFTNTITLCWVLLAAAKIMDVLLGIDQGLAVALACAIALSYSLLAGFWGVVVTDVVQFVMAIIGAIALAWMSWSAVGGTDGVLAAAAQGGDFTQNTLRLLPKPGEGSFFDASFWTTPIAALAVYLGVAWWAVESVDGSTTTVQRIAASRDERQGVLSVMWFNVMHYAFRPWPWIMVALASLVVLPQLKVSTPVAGTVIELDKAWVKIQPESGKAFVVPMQTEHTEEDWAAAPIVQLADKVQVGDTVGSSDSERAYVVMMRRYLPIGLLGLVVASLLAAFMSTIDTHVNLAASFFINDLYRRFLKRNASQKHYVFAARIASALVLVMAGGMASQASSISDLFQFFLAFLSGVGPVYVLRWMWWRVQAITEITAMVASAFATIVLTFVEIDWNLGPFSVNGDLIPEGRMVLVVLFSIGCSLLAIWRAPRPDPRSLLAFYRMVRPGGWWGPVAELAPDVVPARHGKLMLLGVLGGLALVYGSMLGIGLVLLSRNGEAVGAFVASLLGAFAVSYALKHQVTSTTERRAH